MDQDTYNKVAPRLRMFYGVFGLLFLVLLVGLVNVQLLDYTELKEKQERQNYRRILVPGPRGDIYDREGRLLVGNRPLLSAVVYLNELRKEFREEYFTLVRMYRREDSEEQPHIDRNEVAVEARRRVVQRYMNQVNKILGRADLVDPKEIESHFNRELLLPMPLVRDLTPEEYARLTEQLPVDSSIQIVAESARYYPFDDCAAHTLGFVVATEDESAEDVIGSDDLRTFRFKGKVGRTGVESAFNDQLQGAMGGEIWVVDPSGFQHERIDRKLPEKGRDVFTSLDVDLQLVAERAMGDKTGAVIAMDVRTGEVLVLASKPAYNVNDLSPFLSFAVDKDIRERGAWLNRGIQGTYPPGSTFKLITSVAAEANGLIDDDTVVECHGYLQVGGRKFPCHYRAGHGPQHLQEAIANSCNVFYYQMGMDLGIDRLANTARMFGLGQLSGIELSGESHRTVVPDEAYKRGRDLGPWFGGDTANTAIGQGYLLVTPLQMCAFTASLARGETRTKPTILRMPPGSAVRHPGAQPLPISPRSYQRIMEGMRLAALKGTARLAQRNLTMPVAGKTGTAEVHIDGRPSNLAWFVGFAPADNPQIAVVVMIEGTDPNDEYHGGSTAAPIAHDVFQMFEAKHPYTAPAQQ